MPTPTYDLIASNVLGSSASSVTFSSLPQTYRDLVIVVRKATTTSFELQLGGQPNTVSNVRMWGDGTNPGSQAATNNSGVGTYYQANLAIWQVFDYTTTDKHKPVLMRANAADVAVVAAAGRWGYTNAVSTITISTGGTFESGDTFYVYGIVS